MKRLFIVFVCLLFSGIIYAQHYSLFGSTYNGGINDIGMIYKYDPFSKTETKIFDFNGLNGYGPYCPFLSFNGILFGGATAGGKNNVGVLFNLNYYTNKYTVLVQSDSSIGASPDGVLVPAPNGLLYGITSVGGSKKIGTIFCYNFLKPGSDSVVFSFDTVNGYKPDGNIIFDSSSSLLYGLADFGGLYGSGTLYSFNIKTRQYSVLVNFDSINGAGPIGSYIVEASNGMIYGMTDSGGTSNKGVLFRYNPKTAQDTVIVNFNGSNGAYPWCNGIIQANNGLLYGMTAWGGTPGDGVLFSLDPITNAYTVLVNFDNANGGNYAFGTLVQDPDDSLIYGTTVGGGKYNKGTLFSYNIKTNKEIIVHSFSGSPDGDSPYFGPTLVQDSLTSINEIMAKNQNINVYPNPSKGLFNYDIASFEQSINNTIEVYNVLGEKVYQATIDKSQFTITLTDEPSGIYFYRIVSESGSLIASGKITMQK